MSRPSFFAGSRWAQRGERSLALFGVAGVLAVLLGFVVVPVRPAEEFLKRGGYYVMLGTFALFVHALWQLWSQRDRGVEPLTTAQRWIAGGTIALLASIAINAEPYWSKVLNDEFVLQSTAFNMHYFRDVATMVRGYEVQGVFLSTDNYLDKRPYFYPFLISLVHDFTGYRIANAFLVNSALMPLALALVFAFGRALGGFRRGLLALLLLGSLPLLGQNATGSGMELLNFTMIMAALLLAAFYLRAPSGPRLAAFVLTVVLLAQSRYESVLYVAAAALVVLLGWWRAGRVLLPWQAIAAPLLLVPGALQNKVLSASPVLWEVAEKSGRFSVAYLRDNLRGAWSFLFNGNAERANSLLLSGAGLVALAGCVALALGQARRLRSAAPAALALACFSVVIVANTTLVMFYYWSNFDDPMAARFSLPLYTLMAFAVVVVAARLDRRWPATGLLLLLAGGWALPAATGKFGHHYYSHLGIDEIEWQRQFIAERTPGQRMILSNRTSIPWLLQETPAILLDRAKLVADRLEYQLRMPTFREILVFQTLRPTTENGDHQIPPEERLPAWFTLEPLAERRFGTKISRISRLVAVQLPADWVAPGKPVTPPGGTRAPVSSE